MKFLTKWWARRFLGAELLASIVITLVLVVWVEKYGGLTIIDSILSEKRSDIYTVVISVVGSLLGFTIATVSIVLGFASHERMEVVRNSAHYDKLWATFKSTMWVLALSLVVLFIGLLIDRDNDPNIVVFYICFFMATLSGFRLGRCIWALSNIISIVAPRKKTNGF